MAGASHRIGVLEIELRLEEEPQAHPLMDRVSALRAPRLEAVMQRVLDELSPAGQLDRCERVELDLGPLPLNDFDDAFLARLEPALRQALALQLQEQPATAPITPVLELLRLFARTGSLPWWAARSDPRLVNAQLRRALEQDPEALWALVRELQAHPTALERLAAAWDAPTLGAILAAVSPSDHDPATGVDGAEAPLSAEGADVQTAGRSLAGRMRLLQLAARGLRGEALRRALERWTPRVPPDWPHHDDAMPPPWPGSPSRHAPAQETDVNVSPVWTVRPVDLGGEAMAAIPPEALALPQEPRHSLAPPRSSSGSPRSSFESPRPVADRGDPGDLGDPVDLGDPDELGIDDGGLVILWPFFHTLLRRLGYVDLELKLFVSEEARSQAIALLSFLVEGDADPPEWRLALPKVLCGLSPLAPWRLEDPLKPEVLAEGERLLEAVIAHGAMTDALAVEDLRDLMLRRPAVLTSRTGAWLLRVERRPDDALLERFPWSWSWIRLPWMDHPLRVEW